MNYLRDKLSRDVADRPILNIKVICHSFDRTLGFFFKYAWTGPWFVEDLKDAYLNIK